MQRVYELLKKAGVYYLATMEGDQPRVRPFGTIHIFDGKLYIQTGKVKPVSQQMMKNPRIEICAMKDGEVIRIQATAVEDDRVEAKASMLDSYPDLKARYAATDNNTQVLYLKDAVATITSNAFNVNKGPEIIKF
jgi:uncharacterized pyridoxamine 5'-phosphate oxidase family protein